MYILSEDQRGCSQCSYIIGVYGRQTSNFVVGATTADTTTLLQDGVYRVAHVEAGRYEDFVYEMTSTDFDLVVSVLPLSGDSDLYVTACGSIDGHYDPTKCNTHPRAGGGNHTWSATTYGSEILFIGSGTTGTCTPLPGVPCRYYMGVLGYQGASTFMI